mgnify:FL=1|jgi:deoxyuridine 5'-triphosphate nucleotidohydrolase
MEDLKNIEKLLSDNSDKINGSVPDKNKLKSENKSVKKSVNNDCILNGYHKECQVGIKKLYPDVEIPEYKHEGDACCDIRAYRVVKMINDMGIEIEVPSDFESITLYQGYSVRIGTGFKLNISSGWCVNVEGRSGFSFDEGIVVSNAPGKCEYTYKGEYMINLIKVNKKPTVIHKNDRIAQMEIVPQYKMLLEEVEDIEIEDDNDRGEKGLGSSGVK